jgi:uncharacterized protein
MKNNDAQMTISLSEICTSCGMCCDGTLFNKALLKNQADEVLAKNMGMETFIEDQKKRYFKLPCHHFNGCCTVYDKDRPHVCGVYFCQPLKKVQKGTISIDAAKEKIEQTLALRVEILAMAAGISLFKNYTISNLIQEVQPNPTSLIKEHKVLWLQLIGFVAACSQIRGSIKANKDAIV